MADPEVIEYGEPCRGNMGRWGRTVMYMVDGPLGRTPIVDWEDLPEPTEGKEAMAENLGEAPLEPPRGQAARGGS